MSVTVGGNSDFARIVNGTVERQHDARMVIDWLIVLPKAKVTSRVTEISTEYRIVFTMIGSLVEKDLYDSSAHFASRGVVFAGDDFAIDEHIVMTRVWLSDGSGW
jgi:hypothetical protein